MNIDTQHIVLSQWLYSRTKTFKIVTILILTYLSMFKHYRIEIKRELNRKQFQLSRIIHNFIVGLHNRTGNRKLNQSKPD